MKRRPLLFRKFTAWLAPRKRLVVVDGDSLPKKLPRNAITLAREDGDDWCIGMRCPCGCGETLELMLLKEVRPRWDITADRRGFPTLHPSVWLKTGCKSHFWLHSGKVVWCE